LLLIPRILGGAPLVFFGLMHLVGAFAGPDAGMPMKPLLEAAGMPAPALGAIVAPLVQLVAGLLLLGGAFARVGAVLAIATMLGALYTHMKIPNDAWPMPTADNPDAVAEEPVVMMGLAGLVIVCSAIVAWLGAGGLSLDGRGAASGEAQEA